MMSVPASVLENFLKSQISSDIRATVTLPTIWASATLVWLDVAGVIFDISLQDLAFAIRCETVWHPVHSKTFYQTLSSKKIWMMGPQTSRIEKAKLQMKNNISATQSNRNRSINFRLLLAELPLGTSYLLKD